MSLRDDEEEEYASIIRGKHWRWGTEGSLLDKVALGHYDGATLCGCCCINTWSLYTAELELYHCVHIDALYYAPDSTARDGGEQPSSVFSPAVRPGLQDRTIFFFLLFLAVVVVADWTKPNIIFHGLVSSCPWTLEAVWIRWGQCENKTGTLQQRALTVMICNKTDGNRLLFIAKQLKVMSLFEMKKQMNITTPFLSFWPCDNTRTDPNQVALACYYCCRSKLGRSILIRNDSCDMYTL